MKIAIIADPHYDERSRFEECCRIGRWIARDIADRGIDLVLISGDVFERKSTATEREAVADWIEDLAATASVVVVRGNHDALGDLLYLERLSTAHRVTVEEAANVYLVAGAAVACLAWPRKAELLALSEDTTRAAGEQTAADALRAVLRGLGARLKQHDGPRIVLAHASVRGSRVSTGQPMVGCDLEIGIEDLALAGADLYALGHIHMPQDWTINDSPVVYPGSPRRTAFGELEEKGYVVVEIEGHRVTAWQRVPTPATPMVLVDAQWDPETRALVCTNASAWKWDDLDGAEVRLRYAVDPEHREAAAAGARQREEAFRMGGAVSVKVEPEVRPKAAARAPEVAVAVTLDEKLDAFWTARNDVPLAAARERIKTRLHDLEAEVGGDARSAARGGMRLERLRVKGLLAFPGEVEIDLTELTAEQRLVAITGGNGQGKSTLLNAWPCSVWRAGPNVGNLAEIARDRDAYFEATVVNGSRYTIRQIVDAVGKRSETVILDESGSPILDSSKVRDADRWIADHLPSAEVFYASQFAAQREQGVSGQKPGDRKAVLLRALGIERYEALAKAASDRAREARARLATAEARLADERGRAGDPDALGARIDDLRIVASDYEGSLATYRLLLADAEAAAADATALLRDHERRRLEAADLRKRAADEDAKADSARRAVTDLEGRIANNRRVLDRADEIRAAVARDAELAAGLAGLDQDAATLVARRAEPQARQRQAAQDVAKARADLAAARQRLTESQKLTAQLAAAGVLDAAANLERHRARVEQAAAALAEIDAELEGVRGERIAGAEERIDGLRGGLTLIAQGDQTPAATADRVIFADDAAVKAAAEIPHRLAHLASRRKTVADELARDRAVSVEAERLAARKPEYDRAEAQRGPAMAEVDAAERAVHVAESVAGEAQAALAAIDAEASTLGARRGTILDERAALAPVLKLAEPLAQAEARLEELAPQLEAALAAVATAAQEAEALRARAAEVDPGEAPKAPDLDAARAKVANAEKAARDAHAAVAVVERQLQEARTSAARVRELVTERDGITDELADWARLAADLGRGGLQAVEIGNAGPELSELASDLLHACYGPRFTLSVSTTRVGADGRELEGLEIRVLDTVKGTDKPIEAHSGGEVTILDEAYAWALSMLACRRAGATGITIARDEFGAALDTENGPAWIRMMRRAADLIGADRVLFITHDPALQELADVRLHVEAGKVVVR